MVKRKFIENFRIYGACRVNQDEYSFNGSEVIIMKNAMLSQHGSDVESPERVVEDLNTQMLEHLVANTTELSWDTQDVEEDELNFVVYFKEEKEECDSIIEFRDSLNFVLGMTAKHLPD